MNSAGCSRRPWPCSSRNWTAPALPAAIQVLKSCGLAQGALRPTGPTTVDEAEQAYAEREIERVASALTAEDVELAQQRRESDRRFAALTALAV